MREVGPKHKVAQRNDKEARVLESYFKLGSQKVLGFHAEEIVER